MISGYFPPEYKKMVQEENRIKRCKTLGEWLVDNPGDSIRKMAREFMMSKSQVHRDLHYLRFIDDDLYCQVMKILSRRWG